MHFVFFFAQDWCIQSSEKNATSTEKKLTYWNIEREFEFLLKKEEKKTLDEKPQQQIPWNEKNENKNYSKLKPKPRKAIFQIFNFHVPRKWL